MLITFIFAFVYLSGLTEINKGKVYKQGCPIDTDKDGFADFEAIELRVMQEI